VPIAALFLLACAMSRAPLLCVGDPLLDIQVREAEDLIAKYGLRANDALRATPELLPLYVAHVLWTTHLSRANVVPCAQSYDEISRREPVATLVAGGAAQNTARAAAVSVVQLARRSSPDQPSTVHSPAEQCRLHRLRWCRCARRLSQ